MIVLRPANERGHANFGWLDSHHTFSFGNYYDPRHMGVSVLRVINEDRVAAGGGFAPHSHQNMEILSYVLDGALEHKDSMGTSSVIRPGEVQLMSAGTGVTHSEYNAQRDKPVHFLQIWLLPAVKGVAPRYQQKSFAEDNDKLRLVVSPDGAEGSLELHQDARIYRVRLNPGEALEQALPAGRTYYFHAARGAGTLNERGLVAGDGVTLFEESTLTLGTTEGLEGLLFDLP